MMSAGDVCSFVCDSVHGNPRIFGMAEARLQILCAYRERARRLQKTISLSNPSPPLQVNLSKGIFMPMLDAAQIHSCQTEPPGNLHCLGSICSNALWAPIDSI